MLKISQHLPQIATSQKSILRLNMNKNAKLENKPFTAFI